MSMNKTEKNIAAVAAILVGCGVAIGAMAYKIYKDKNREYLEEVKHLKNETDFKLSKEFLQELKEELKQEREDAEAKAAIVNTPEEEVESPVHAEAIEDVAEIQVEEVIVEEKTEAETPCEIID